MKFKKIFNLLVAVMLLASMVVFTGCKSENEEKVPETPVVKIDYSGTYTGTLYVTETGKDIEVTTEVTYEKDFGDGAYYNIVCSNNETGSKYINGSYFVRWSTGEANIAGAKFVFSADGSSFKANMIDFNNKEWGVINCRK